MQQKDLKGENITLYQFPRRVSTACKKLICRNIWTGFRKIFIGWRHQDAGNKAIAMNRSIHRVIKESEKAFKVFR